MNIMPYILILLFTLSIVHPVSAEHGDEPTEVRGSTSVQSELQGALKDARQKLVEERMNVKGQSPEAKAERKTEFKARLEAVKAERIESRTEIKLRFDTKVKARIEAKVASSSRATEAIFQGIENQDIRIADAIDKLHDAGADVHEAEQLLEEARQALSDAREVVAEAEAEAKEALESEEISRQKLVGALETGITARKQVLAAYRAILPALKQASLEIRMNTRATSTLTN